MLLGILPFVCLFMTILFCSSKYKTYDAIICASIIWGMFIFISTLILSIFTLIVYPAIMLFWVLYFLIVLTLIVKNRPAIVLPSISRKELLYLSPILFILIINLFVAFAYPPNTWDSMTYHMPKIMHWIQNQSQAFYTTSIPRQNDLAPFTETIIMNSMILSKTDVFANLVQFFAFLGSLCVVAGIVKVLGGTSKTQYIAVFFFATLPMAILQATSTQTDLAVTFWILCFVYVFLKWIGEKNYKNTIYVGCALGLSILTKGTAYVIALPFVVYFSYLILRNFRTCFIQGVLIACIVISINLPHFVRTYEHYGSFFTSSSSNIVKGMSINAFLARISFQFLVNTFVDINSNANVCYGKICDFLEVDDEKNLAYSSNISSSYNHEDTASNPLHTLLILATFIVFFLRRKTFPKSYAYLVLSSFLAFAALLTVQPWLTRLQVPLFALCAPLVAHTFSFPKLNKTWILTLLLSSLFIYATYPLLKNMSRPVINRTGQLSVWTNSRDELYFVNRAQLYGPYSVLINTLAQKNIEGKIGLYMGVDSWEYPIWVLLSKYFEHAPMIEHVSQKDIEEGKYLNLIVRDKQLPGERNNDIISLYQLENSEYHNVALPLNLIRAQEVIYLNKSTFYYDKVRFVRGFFAPERWGVWTNGKKSTLITRFSPETKALMFKLAHVYAEQDLTISANGVEVYSETSIKPNSEIIINFPESILAEIEAGEVIEFEFDIPKAVSPKSRGESGDTRELGIGLVSITAYDKIYDKYAELKELPIGKPLTADVLSNAVILQSGFSKQENWGRWTEGKKANLAIRFSPETKALVFKLAHVYANQDLTISANGIEVYSETNIQPSSEIIINFPESILAEIEAGEVIEFEFDIPKAVSPKSRGESGDSRELGIGLVSIEAIGKEE